MGGQEGWSLTVVLAGAGRWVERHRREGGSSSGDSWKLERLRPSARRMTGYHSWEMEWIPGAEEMDTRGDRSLVRRSCGYVYWIVVLVVGTNGWNK